MEQLLPIGCQVEVRVEKILNSCALHVRVLDPSERMHELMTSLNLAADEERSMKEKLQGFGGSSFNALPSCSIDEMVKKLVVYKTRENTFVRGIVEKRRDNGANDFLVRNLDTRVMSINIHHKDIRLLPQQFGIKVWPPGIQQFQLAQVTPITLEISDGMLTSRKVDSEKWDSAAIQLVRQLVKDRVVVCKVENMDPVTGVYSVMMWTQKRQREHEAPEAVINVNEELVRKEFARVAGPLTKQPGSMSDSPSMSDTNPKTATRLSGITPKSRSPGISTANVPVGSPHHDLIKNGGHATGGRSPCRAPRDPSFNINTFKCSTPRNPLILGCNDLTPVHSIRECNFCPKIEQQYIKGRGSSHTDLSVVQRYGWPFFQRGRDGILVFHPDNTLRPELTFLIPLLSVLTKGTYARCPKNYSPKVLIVVPSCKDADILTRYCRESLDESLKYALNVYKAYAISKFAPHAELYNNQDLLVITPQSLIDTYKEHVPADNRSIYFSNTCHLILHKSHELFTRHRKQMHLILDLLRNEVHEQDYKQKCQIAMFSDTWLPVYHAVARKYLSDPVTIIQNRTESALHSGVTTHVEEYQNSQLKLDSFISTVKKLCDSRKKIAIFVKTPGTQLVEALSSKAVPCYELDELGTQIQNWSRGSAMVVSDEVATQFCIPDCEILLNYDLPNSLAAFNNRLSFLESHFTEQHSAKDCHSIFFITEDDDVQGINNLVKYLSRYSKDIPASLKDKADKGEKLRQSTDKSSKSLCPYLLQYGSCSLRSCQMRHAVLKKDAPGSSLRLLDIPLKGKIQVKITAVSDGNRFFGRIISVTPGTCVNAEEEFQTFHQKVQGWFTNVPESIDEDKLKEDLETRKKEVTVGVKNTADKMFYRARVSSVRYNADRAGRVDGVIARCVDTGEEGLYPLETVYRFPARLAEQPAFATELIVCGIKPAENDRHFASYCKEELQKRIQGQVLEGNIELALGNCLWVRTLEKRQLLPSLKLMSSELSVKKVIMDKKFGITNEAHIKRLRAAVREALPDEVPEDYDVITSRVTMETGKRHVVCMSHVQSPHSFYVNVIANMSSLQTLEEQLNDLQLLDSILPCWLPRNTFCIARFSKDNRWYRAEIKRTWHDRYHVHFVDYGNEDTAVPSNYVKTIPQHFLELPFQALHCSLSGIEPIYDEWRSTDQGLMIELTDGEDFFCDVKTFADDDYKYTVDMCYDDTMPLIDILCRNHVGLNTQQVDNSAFAELFNQLYRSDDDYVVLCAAESLEADMRSGDKTAVPGDLATVCRLCKLRYSDEDTMVHLVSALNLLLVRREDDEWVTELIEEEIVKELIKKLTSPSPAHKPTADLIATVGANKRILHIIAETQCIVALCELCVYKQQEGQKLLAVLRAIKTLVTVQRDTDEDKDLKGSDNIRKEIKSTGHMRTLMKFLREASDECLDQVLVLFGEMLAAEKEMFSFFKEEGGLKDVCRATKRSNSPAVIGLVKLFGTDCKESLTLMKKEGLANWFKELKEKRRDFGTRMACEQYYKMISAHKVVEEFPEDEQPAPAPMLRAPILTPIDEPAPLKEGIIIEHLTKEPSILWYQRKRTVSLSIQLKDVGKHELKIEEKRILIFSTWHSGYLYRFRYKLFDDVNKMTSQVKSSEVLVLLSKVSPSRWTTLLDTKRGNVKLDFSRACDSEDETDSEGEEIPTREPLPTGDDVEICIGEDDSDSDGFVAEEEEVGDDFSGSMFSKMWVNMDSEDMDGLE